MLNEFKSDLKKINIIKNEINKNTNNVTYKKLYEHMLKEQTIHNLKVYI